MVAVPLEAMYHLVTITDVTDLDESSQITIERLALNYIYNLGNVYFKRFPVSRHNISWALCRKEGSGHLCCGADGNASLPLMTRRPKC